MKKYNRAYSVAGTKGDYKGMDLSFLRVLGEEEKKYVNKNQIDTEFYRAKYNILISSLK